MVVHSTDTHPPPVRGGIVVGEGVFRSTFILSTLKSSHSTPIGAILSASIDGGGPPTPLPSHLSQHHKHNHTYTGPVTAGFHQSSPSTPAAPPASHPCDCRVSPITPHQRRYSRRGRDKPVDPPVLVDVLQSQVPMMEEAVRTGTSQPAWPWSGRA